MILEVLALRKAGIGGVIYVMHRSSVEIPNAHEPELVYVKDISDFNGRYLGSKVVT